VELEDLRCLPAITAFSKRKILRQLRARVAFLAICPQTQGLAQRLGQPLLLSVVNRGGTAGVAQIDEIGGLGMFRMFIPAGALLAAFALVIAWRQTPQTATCTEALVDKLPRRKRIGPGRLVNMGRMNIRHAAALALVGWYLMVPPPVLHSSVPVI